MNLMVVARPAVSVRCQIVFASIVVGSLGSSPMIGTSPNRTGIPRDTNCLILSTMRVREPDLVRSRTRTTLCKLSATELSCPGYVGWSIYIEESVDTRGTSWRENPPPAETWTILDIACPSSDRSTKGPVLLPPPDRSHRTAVQVLTRPSFRPSELQRHYPPRRPQGSSTTPSPALLPLCRSVRATAIRIVVRASCDASAREVRLRRLRGGFR
jgi:hypothetical protein